MSHIFAERHRAEVTVTVPPRTCRRTFSWGQKAKKNFERRRRRRENFGNFGPTWGKIDDFQSHQTPERSVSSHTCHFGASLMWVHVHKMGRQKTGRRSASCMQDGDVHTCTYRRCVRPRSRCICSRSQPQSDRSRPSTCRNACIAEDAVVVEQEDSRGQPIAPRHFAHGAGSIQHVVLGS